MLCGLPPFYNENIDRMYDLIKLGELKFPKKIKISSDAQDIITKVKIQFLNKLLDRNPDTRFGANGLSDIKAHPFFSNIDFELVYEKKVNFTDFTFS